MDRGWPGGPRNRAKVEVGRRPFFGKRPLRAGSLLLNSEHAGE